MSKNRGKTNYQRVKPQNVSKKPPHEISSTGTDVIPAMKYNSTETSEAEYENMGKFEGTYEANIDISAKIPQKVLVIEQYKVKYLVTEHTKKIKDKARLTQLASSSFSIFVAFMIAACTSDFHDIGIASASYIKGIFTTIMAISALAALIFGIKWFLYKDVTDSDFINSLNDESK